MEEHFLPELSKVDDEVRAYTFREAEAWAEVRGCFSLALLTIPCCVTDDFILRNYYERLQKSQTGT